MATVKTTDSDALAVIRALGIHPKYLQANGTGFQVNNEKLIQDGLVNLGSDADKKKLRIQYKD